MEAMEKINRKEAKGEMRTEHERGVGPTPTIPPRFNAKHTGKIGVIQRTS